MIMLRAMALILFVFSPAWTQVQASPLMLRPHQPGAILLIRHFYHGQCPHLCRQWFDGCNNCMCGRDGRFNTCTEYRCIWHRRPRCITWGF